MFRSAPFANDMRERLWLLNLYHLPPGRAISLQLAIKFALALLPRTKWCWRKVSSQLPCREHRRLILSRTSTGNELLIVFSLGFLDSMLYNITVYHSCRIPYDLLQSLELLIVTVRHAILLAMNVGKTPRL